MLKRQWLDILVIGSVLPAACGGCDGGDASHSGSVLGDGLVRELDAVTKSETAEKKHDGKHCGDGKVKKDEPCDDGNTGAGDGCDAMCHIEPGYACDGEPSICVTICGDGLVVGAELCDDGNTSAGDGCDATCHIETGYSCKGAPSLCTPGCGNGWVAGSEDCDDGNAKDDDGCSSVCQVEPGFTCSGERSLCCIPEVEPNHDSASANGPVSLGTLRCGSVDPIGDADYFSFTLPAAGDVTMEVFSGLNGAQAITCEVIDPRITLYGSDGQTIIAANSDWYPACSRIDPWLHPAVRQLSAGTYYVRVEQQWGGTTIPHYYVSIDATVCGNGIVEGFEQCDGGPSCDPSCTVTAPLPGESWETAQPLAGCPIAPTSTARLDTPSCFPATGAVQWYSYVATDNVVSLSANVAGPVAIVNSAGQEIRCTLDATQLPLATFATTGQTFYVAVPSSTSIGCLGVNSDHYGGVGGTLTNLNVTYPLAATGFYSMTMSSSTIFMILSQLLSNTKILWVPKSGNTMATAQTFTTTQIGRDIIFANGRLFSLDDKTFATFSNGVPASRFYRMYDEATNTWAATEWDLTPTYPSPGQGCRAVAYDGSIFITATYGPGDFTPNYFYSYSAAAPSTPASLGTSALGLQAVTGIAADSQYLYLGALDEGHGFESAIYRIPRSNPAAAPVLIAHILVHPAAHIGMAVDDTTSANYLYVRDVYGDIHVVMNPGSAAPLHPGPISTLGNARSGEQGMAYDRAENAIYFNQTETAPAPGAIMKLQ